MSKIYSFRGEYAFLSNFYLSPIRYEGRIWRTVEHAFQAAKTLDAAEKRQIQSALTPGLAKKIGRRVALRYDWEDIKMAVMIDLVHLKFQDPVLRAKLLATYPNLLEEGNTWGDRFWGTVRGDGQNALGRILMMERSELMK